MTSLGGNSDVSLKSHHHHLEQHESGVVQRTTTTTFETCDTTLATPWVGIEPKPHTTPNERHTILVVVVLLLLLLLLLLLFLAFVVSNRKSDNGKY